MFICGVDCEVLDFIVTNQKAAIIGRVVVGELNSLKARSGNAGLHSKKSRSHLAHRLRLSGCGKQVASVILIASR